MDFRHLQYFVTVAEERNFRRAAQKLGISQPPLSQQIMLLEKQYGHQLLIRRARDVELTDAGRILYEGARSILQLADDARRQLKRAQSGEIGGIAIGFTPGIAFHPLIPAVLRRWRRELPDVELHLRQAPTDDLCAGLVSGIDDLILIRPPAQKLPGITVRVLDEEKMVVALPRDHPMAACREIRLIDLADDPFVLWPRNLAPSLYDSIIRQCCTAGFTPRVRIEAPEKSTAVTFVAAGLGVSVIPASLQQIRSDEIACLPIGDLPFTAPVAFAKRRSDRDPLLARFIDLTLNTPFAT